MSYVYVETAPLPWGEFEIRHVVCKCQHAAIRRSIGTTSELIVAGWVYQRVTVLGETKRDADEALDRFAEFGYFSGAYKSVAGPVCPECNDRGRIVWIDRHVKIIRDREVAW